LSATEQQQVLALLEEGEEAPSGSNGAPAGPVEDGSVGLEEEEERRLLAAAFSTQATNPSQLHTAAQQRSTAAAAAAGTVASAAQLSETEQQELLALLEAEEGCTQAAAAAEEEAGAATAPRQQPQSLAEPSPELASLPSCTAPGASQDPGAVAGLVAGTEALVGAALEPSPGLASEAESEA
jgi:hypothetical protein